MKKSSRIQLVLVTALLASCRTVVLPERQQPIDPYIPDSALTKAPADTASPDCACRGEEDYPVYERYVSPLDFWYESFGYISYPRMRYYIGHVNGPGHIAVRGGFGKSAFHVSA